MRNDFEIVLIDRDQDILAKEGFNVEEAASESYQTGGWVASGTNPLQKKKMSELLRAATIDSFQGEEAKVVIISLVRSSEESKVGFLKTNNRINVLLSRAQHGMYLISNTDTTPPNLCGLNFLAYYKERTRLVRLLVYATLGTWRRRFKSRSQTTLPGSALKVVANYLTIDASTIAVIDVRQDVIPRACIESSRARNPANAFTAHATTIVRSKPAARIAVYT